MESVFGRDGDVFAEGGDYQTGLIDNASSLPGATLNDALASIDGSSERENESTVPGASISDALDYLLANLPIPERGHLYETFSGGNNDTIVALNNDMRLGDNRWNARLATGNEVGWSIEKIADGSSSVGVLRIHGPTHSEGSPNGVVLYLGPPGTVEDPTGVIYWNELARVDFRARVVDPLVPYRATLFGLHNEDGVAISNSANAATFGSSTDEDGIPSTWTAFTVRDSFFPEVTDTGVLTDDEWHDFRIERVSASEVRFYIDDVLVATHSNPITLPADLPMNPFFSAGITASGLDVPSTPSDIDTFELTPV